MERLKQQRKIIILHAFQNNNHAYNSLMLLSNNKRKLCINLQLFHHAFRLHNQYK